MVENLKPGWMMGAHPLRYFYRFAAAAGLILLACVAVIWFLDDPQKRTIATDIISPVINLFAVLALFLASRKTARYSKRLAFVWGFLGLAQLSYFLGDLTWLVLEVFLHESPFPSIADIFYLAYYPLFLVGIFLMPGTSYKPIEWIKRVLDMSIIFLAALLLFWNYLIGPLILNNPETDLLTRVLSVAYPVGDFLLIPALLMILYSRISNQNKWGLILLALSVVITVVFDCAFSYQSLQGTYQPGFLDIGFLTAYLLTALAGGYQVLNPAPVNHTPEKALYQFDRLNGLLSFFPYLWLLAVLGLLIQTHFTEMPLDYFYISMGTVSLFILVIARQFVTHFENQDFFTRLQTALSQVQQQAQELEKANQNLQIEIGAKQRAEAQRLYDALHDEITGLPNRTLFMDRLGQMIEHHKRHPDNSCSVFLIDLDYFKNINDSMGHEVGDALLAAVGWRLVEHLRSEDTIARLGGDEFLILLENQGNEDVVRQSANRILEVLKAPYPLAGNEVTISASMGIVSNIHGYENQGEVLRDIDIAMYRAKELGRGRFELFKLDMRTRTIERRILEKDLNRAVNYQEFQLYYQPIFSLQTFQIVGFEALVRWQHPTRGFLLPGQFIPFAEESDLILPIGKWVLYEACSQMKKWHLLHPNNESLSISVNISGRQLKQPDFVEQIEQALYHTGLNPRCLKLEITEGVLVESNFKNDYYTRLRKMGVLFQIDDFGTGYSSLSYLQRFPLDMIKIDQSFVQGIGRDEKSIELIRAIVSMAQGLEMDVVAEGIETAEQLAMLKRLSCKFGQGYLYSKPVDSIEAGKMLKKLMAPQFTP
jgi:diguanylate cyclase (GGDEF)-like protein